MSPEEEEVTLIVKRNHLSALEFRHRREECLEETADSVAETSDKPVQDKFGEMGRRARVALNAPDQNVSVQLNAAYSWPYTDLLRELDGRKLEVGRGPFGEVDHSQRI